MCDTELGAAAQSAIWDAEHQTGESHNMSASSLIIAEIKRVYLEFSLIGCMYAAYFEADL